MPYASLYPPSIIVFSIFNVFNVTMNQTPNGFPQLERGSGENGYVCTDGWRGR